MREFRSGPPDLRGNRDMIEQGRPEFDPGRNQNKDIQAVNPERLARWAEDATPAPLLARQGRLIENAKVVTPNTTALSDISQVDFANYLVKQTQCAPKAYLTLRPDLRDLAVASGSNYPSMTLISDAQGLQTRDAICRVKNSLQNSPYRTKRATDSTSPQEWIRFEVNGQEQLTSQTAGSLKLYVSFKDIASQLTPDKFNKLLEDLEESGCRFRVKIKDWPYVDRGEWKHICASQDQIVVHLYSPEAMVKALPIIAQTLNPDFILPGIDPIVNGEKDSMNGYLALEILKRRMNSQETGPVTLPDSARNALNEAIMKVRQHNASN